LERSDGVNFHQFWTNKWEMADRITGSCTFEFTVLNLQSVFYRVF